MPSPSNQETLFGLPAIPEDPVSQSIKIPPAQETFSQIELQLAGIPEIGADLVLAYKNSLGLRSRFNFAITQPDPYLQTLFYRRDDNYSNASLIGASRNFTLFEFPRFKDQIVIDVGSGQHAIGYLAAVAAGAKAYIAIDLAHSRACLNAITEVSGSNPTIPYAVVDRNARDFLPLIPDNSVSFLVSGIDAFLYIQDIPGLRDLAAKMTPKLHVQGAILSINSDLDFPDLTVNRVEVKIPDGKIATKKAL